MHIEGGWRIGEEDGTRAKRKEGSFFTEQNEREKKTESKDQKSNPKKSIDI